MTCALGLFTFSVFYFFLSVFSMSILYRTRDSFRPIGALALSEFAVLSLYKASQGEQRMNGSAYITVWTNPSLALLTARR